MCLRGLDSELALRDPAAPAGRVLGPHSMAALRGPGCQQGHRGSRGRGLLTVRLRCPRPRTNQRKTKARTVPALAEVPDGRHADAGSLPSTWEKGGGTHVHRPGAALLPAPGVQPCEEATGKLRLKRQSHFAGPQECGWPKVANTCLVLRGCLPTVLLRHEQTVVTFFFLQIT